MPSPDFIYGVTPGDVIYDIETYPNVFTCRLIHTDTLREWKFEISDYRYDDLTTFMDVLAQQGCRMVGFNNIGFDYPVIHALYQNQRGQPSAMNLYDKAMSIIKAPDNARFAHMVWESDWLIPQVDLYKIHHFDNKARTTSLKMLEFNMHMDSIEDLPFDVGIELSPEQTQVLHDYNHHDCVATLDFYNESKDKIKFREELTEKYNRNFINHNDTKIGKDYFIMRLEEANPGCCYRYVDGKRHMVQTERSDGVRLADVISPTVRFDHPEFTRILNWFKSQVITETKGVFKDISCTVDGFQFDFGTGGIHGSVESQIVEADDDHVIIDLDVASYYPNLAIVNNFYPEHLGTTFCKIYQDVYEQRKSYPKGTAENAMLKLALNGVYGDSNNKYSPFYDPQYTMSITINGQLLLCMLAEVLMSYHYVEMIQINTDGLTIRCPRSTQPWVQQVAQWWEQLTGLSLDSANYSRMMIRDVNNYIAEYTDGKVKRKGAYEYQLDWHQNHSALVVPKAAEAALLHGIPVDVFIRDHKDDYDFMLRAKVPRSSYLEYGLENVGTIVRYYVSNGGDILEKIMPPTGPEGQFKKANGVTQGEYDHWHEMYGNTYNADIHTKNMSVHETRRTGICTGWNVKLCNNIKEFDGDINYDWYVKEASKLVDPLRGVK